MKILLITSIFIFASTTFAQDDAKPSSPFDNLMSLGYTPKTGASQVNTSYTTLSYSSAVKIGSAKYYDFDANSSTLNASYFYGFDDTLNFGFAIGNVFSSTSKYTYTSAAKTAGAVDETVTRKGFTDPTLSVSKVLKETGDLRIIGTIFYSPSTGSRKADTANSGGSSGGLGVNFVKAFQKSEFKVSIGYVSQQNTKSEDSGGSTSESKGGNTLRLSTGINYYFSENSAFTVLYTRSGYDSSTTSYSTSSNEQKIDPYSETTIVAGFQYALDKDLFFLAGLTSLSSESASITQGATVAAAGAVSGNGGALGITFMF